MLAAEVPELTADAIHAAFLEVESNHKRAIAGVLAGVWYLVTVAILDRIRADAPSVPDVESVPDKITALRMIFEKSATLSTMVNN
jgi:hypothetical protein